MGRPKKPLSPWVIGSIALIALIAYAVRFRTSDWANDPAAWGQLGDYLGGILNPIVAFAAFMWLVESVRIQRNELSETKEALQKSQKAQQDQANTSLLASRIQALNVELAGVTNHLAHFRTKQLQLLQYQNTTPPNTIGPPTNYLDELGKHVKVSEGIAEVSKEIQSLVEKEARLLKQIRDLSEQFNCGPNVD